MPYFIFSTRSGENANDCLQALRCNSSEKLVKIITHTSTHSPAGSLWPALDGAGKNA